MNVEQQLRLLRPWVVRDAEDCVTPAAHHVNDRVLGLLAPVNAAVTRAVAAAIWATAVGTGDQR